MTHDPGLQAEVETAAELTLDDLIAVALADGELWVAWWLIWWRHQRRLTPSRTEPGVS